MNTAKINETMTAYVRNADMAGGALLIRNREQVLYRNIWGEVKEDSIYRLMSMTKCITAAAVMILVERGEIGLDDPLSKYIPEFKDMQVMADERYEFSSEKMKKIPLMLLTFKMKNVKRRPASREMTIRDLLSHSSGIQQGLAGLLAMIKEKEQYSTLREFVLHYSKHVLDFDPGTGTGYSPIAGFDILAYVVSKVSGMCFEDFMQKEICAPLGMKNTTFFLNEEQKSRLVKVYKKKKDRLIDVTGTKEDMAGVLHQKEVLFEHGCGGLYSTLDDYARFGEMLLGGGTRDNVRILNPETVELMHTEAPKIHLEPEPGYVWGLGMKIRQDPAKAGILTTRGTYGWSGAFGTHFFISPEDGIEVVFMMNRSDIGGSGSYISARLEELIFE